MVFDPLNVRPTQKTGAVVRPRHPSARSHSLRSSLCESPIPSVRPEGESFSPCRYKGEMLQGIRLDLTEGGSRFIDE
jgi:hypothetical protein